MHILSHPAWPLLRAVVFAPFLVFGVAPQAQPANDDLASALTIAALPYVSPEVPTADATLEPSEAPSSCPFGGASVWWAWTPSADQRVTVWSEGSRHEVSIWTGPDHPLTEFDCYETSSTVGFGDRLYLEASAGTTYYIRVLGDENGRHELHVASAPRPPTDHLANAEPVDAIPYIDTQTTVDDSAEPGELDSACGGASGSIWWRWTPSESQRVRLFVDQPFLGAGALSVWTRGDHPLDEEACEDPSWGRLYLNAQAGTTYYVRLADLSDSEAGRAYRLRIVDATPPPTDDLADAAEIVATIPFSDTQTTRDATSEEGELRSECRDDSGDNAIWWRWTPTANERILFWSDQGADNQSVLSVWLGSQHPLTEVDCTYQFSEDGRSYRLFLDGQANRTYYVRLSNGHDSTEGGTYRLRVEPVRASADLDGNLLVNPDAESNPVGNQVPGWIPLDNDPDWTVWRQRLTSDDRDVLPQGGDRMFVYTDDGPSELSQTVDVSEHAAFIDEGRNEVTFRGYGRSYRSNGFDPEPTTQFVVDYLDATESALETFDSGAFSDLIAWREVADTRTPPVGTRAIRVRMRAADQRGSASTGFFDELSLVMRTVNSGPGVPTNDDLAASTPITTLPFAGVGSTVDDTLEPGEAGPSCREPSGSIWWRWTPSESQRVVAWAEDGATVHTLSVWTGSAHPLREEACYYSNIDGGNGFPHRLYIDAEAGQTYYFRLADQRDTDPGGDYTFRVEPAPTPPGDDLIDATEIVTAPFAGAASTTDDSVEPGEASPSCRTLSGSVWWRWTPAQPQRVLAWAEDGATVHTLSVWTGSAHPLREEACYYSNIDGGNGFPHRLYIDAEAGQTYYFRLADQDDRHPGGPYRLRIEPVNASGDNPNNLLANPDAEPPLDSGAIRGWAAVTGPVWTTTQESDGILPQGGDRYFVPGAADRSEVRQDVDVSALQTQIDEGRQRFDFEGYVRTVGADAAQVIVEFRDAANQTALAAYNSGENTSPDAWRLLSDTRFAPAGTRFVRVRLVALRTEGIPNNGHVDELLLTTATVSGIPDPPPDVTVTATPPPAPAPRQPATITVEATNFVATEATLFYRQGGQSAYQQTPLELTGTTYSATIPADDVTERGVEYYAQLSNGTYTFTFPSTDPAATPAALRIPIARATSPVAPAPGGFRMISAPVDLDDTDLTALLADDLGAPDPDRWQVYLWNPAAQTYQRLDEIGTGLDRGAAYWLTTASGAAFSVENGSSPDLTTPITIPLADGWNQIGTPFPFPVSWSDVQITGTVESPVFWDGNDYATGQTLLQPWEGYFVFNGSGGPATLIVPPIAAPDNAAAPVPAKSGEAPVAALDLAATLPDRGLRDARNVVGLLPSGASPLLTTEPPGIGEHLQLSVSAPTDGRPLARSLLPLHGDGRRWDATLAWTAPLAHLTQRTRATLDLSPRAPLPEGIGLRVLDPATGAVLARQPGPLALDLVPNEPLALVIALGPPTFLDAVQDEVAVSTGLSALTAVYPNPARGAVRVEYQIATPGPGHVELLDALGRHVATLASGEHDAGAHALTWDPGRHVASGLYVLRLRTGDAVRTRTLTLTR